MPLTPPNDPGAQQEPNVPRAYNPGDAARLVPPGMGELNYIQMLLGGLLDQQLYTTSTPTFVSVILSGLTASQLVATDANKQLVSAAVGTSLSLSGGTINTIQGIRTADSPTFTNLTLSAAASTIAEITVGAAGRAAQWKFTRGAVATWVGPTATNEWHLWCQENISFIMALNNVQVLRIDPGGACTFAGGGTFYSQVILVAKGGTKYTTIQSAINAVTDASTSKRYLIQVGPGLWTEQITMKDFVDVRGMGKHATQLQFTGNNNGTVIMDDDCQIEDVLIEMTGTGTEWGIVATNKSRIHIRNVDILGGAGDVSQGIKITGNTWLTCFIEHCVINYLGTTGYGIYITGYATTPQNIDTHIVDTFVDSFNATTGGGIYIADCNAGRMRSSLLRTSAAGFDLSLNRTSAGTVDFLIDSSTLEFGTTSVEVGANTTLYVKHSLIDSNGGAGTISWSTPRYARVGIGADPHATGLLHLDGSATAVKARIYDSALATDGFASMRIGKADSSNNALGMEYKQGLTVSRFSMHFYGDNFGDALTLWKGGNVGIGVLDVAPADKLKVVGAIAATTTLGLGDTNLSHFLRLACGSDLTADRILTLTTGDAARTLSILGTSAINQDVQTTASPTFAGLTVGSLAGVILGTAGVLSALDYVNWTTPSYSSGNFTASGSMTWTVEAGDVGSYAYAIIGKIMFLVFSLTNTAVGGTPSNQLKVAIPASKVATKNTLGYSLIYNNSTYTTGYCSVDPSGTVVNISMLGAPNYTAGAVHVWGNIQFEIN